MKRILLAFSILVSAQVVGQPSGPPAVFVPASPTQLDRIRADFDVPQAPNSNTTTVAGNLVKTDVFLGSGVVGPPPVTVPYSALFGPLLPGTYTYEIYVHYDDGTVELRSRQNLVVSARPELVPVMSPAVSMILILVLLLVALVALGRISA